MQVFQTAGVPPRRGRTIFPTIGWTRNRRVALTNRVTPNSFGTRQLRGGRVRGRPTWYGGFRRRRGDEGTDASSRDQRRAEAREGPDYDGHHRGPHGPPLAKTRLFVHVPVFDQVEEIFRGLGDRRGRRGRFAAGLGRALAALRGSLRRLTRAAAVGLGPRHPPRPGRGRGRGGRLRLRAEPGHDVRPAPLVPLDVDQPVLGRVLQQLAERPVPVVLLIERGLLPLHGVLDHGREEHLLVLAPQGQERVEEQREDLLLVLRELGREAGDSHRRPVEVVVVNELVAVVAQEVGRR